MVIDLAEVVVEMGREVGEEIAGCDRLAEDLDRIGFGKVGVRQFSEGRQNGSRVESMSAISAAFETPFVRELGVAVADIAGLPATAPIKCLRLPVRCRQRLPAEFVISPSLPKVGVGRILLDLGFEFVQVAFVELG